jgi:hypothetical protein
MSVNDWFRQNIDTDLLRLYVSRGGGVNRLFNIMGIWARMSSVIRVQSDPLANEYG